MYAKKISPIPLHHFRQGRRNPCFQVLYTKFWYYYLKVTEEIKIYGTRQQFFNLLSKFCESLNCNVQFFVLVWLEWHLVWSSAAAADLLQISTCCTFKDTLLYTFVVKNFELLLPFYNLETIWPFSPDLHQQWISAQRISTYWNFFFYQFSAYLGDMCAWKSK